ncbi:hypothetical protein COU57_05265 [Candidatus Pacearchaeota archaeon CG10_big_fil_rev_8_21_14_0_10_32_14]|nr:MAG: hypothetical protein COU57_05265 [Candidatus Pacearchaeota archaeon CG10_big_fil_rev_8_21_14_0_10_32_14]
MQIKVNNFLRYEGFVVVGVLMTLGTLIKLSGIIDFSSDWFWLIAGIGVTIEGAISQRKQKQFDSKYKIVTKDEYEMIIKHNGDEVTHIVH